MFTPAFSISAIDRITLELPKLNFSKTIHYI